MSLEIGIVAWGIPPYRRSGGAGRLAAALSRELPRLGHRVTVFLPHHERLGEETEPRLSPQAIGEVEVPLGGARERATVTVAELPVGRPPHPRLVLIGHERFFRAIPASRAGVRGAGARDGVSEAGRPGADRPDAAEARIFFDKAVLESLKLLRWAPRVLHVQDDSGAPLPLLLREVYDVDPVYRGIRTLLTLHDLRRRWMVGREWAVDRLGVDPGLVAPLAPLEFFDRASLLKAGILYADFLTTIGPTHAEEIQRSIGDEPGLEGVLRARRERLRGILHGIDTEKWNPSTDALIPYTYSARAMQGKLSDKIRLLETMELPVEPEVPVLVLIAPLVESEGFGLLETIGGDFFGQRLKLVVLGQDHGPFETRLENLRRAFPRKLGFTAEPTDPLLHLAYAGGDLLLVAPRREPCGRRHLRGFRYGTVPIAFATGGLIDAVDPYNPETGKGDGFLFETYEAGDLLAVIQRALAVYPRKNTWKKLVAGIMRRDDSWTATAREYASVYGRLVES